MDRAHLSGGGRPRALPIFGAASLHCLLLLILAMLGCRSAASVPSPESGSTPTTARPRTAASPAGGAGRPATAASPAEGAGRSRPRPARHVSLPMGASERYLLGSQPLPVPAGGLFVHLELAPLGRRPDGARLGRAFWKGLRVESAGSALVGSYLRRCGLDPLRGARAVSLVQPLQGRPGSDRVMVLWGLLGARRLVACLGGAVVADGGRTAVLVTGGEPGLALHRAASDLHVDVLALDADTLIVSSGTPYRRAVRALAGVPAGSGAPGVSGGSVAPGASGGSVAPGGFVASIVGQPLYRKAVAEAPEGTVLLALAPRLPRALPHLRLPSDVPRNVREGHLHVRLTQSGLGLSVHLGVRGKGRAARWARRLPGRVGRIFPYVPAIERPFLAGARPSASGDILRLDLDVPRSELTAFGRAAERWLPW